MILRALTCGAFRFTLLTFFLLLAKGPQIEYTSHMMGTGSVHRPRTCQDEVCGNVDLGTGCIHFRIHTLLLKQSNVCL